MPVFLIQDYCGGTIQRYRGKYQQKAVQRIRDYGRAGWSPNQFVIVEAQTLSEAHKKAQAVLSDRKGLNI
jgi:uncharacterized protein YoaH (UPF0181 family)